MADIGYVGKADIAAFSCFVRILCGAFFIVPVRRWEAINGPVGYFAVSEDE